MGTHDHFPESPRRESSQWRSRTVERLRRVRGERLREPQWLRDLRRDHLREPQWLRKHRRERPRRLYAAAGMVGAIAAGSVLAVTNGQGAAAEGPYGISGEPLHLIQSAWDDDTRLQELYAEGEAFTGTDPEAEAELLSEAHAALLTANEQARIERLEVQDPQVRKPEAAEAPEPEPEPEPEWISPSNSRITSYYGQRWGRLHAGMDFGNWFDEPIWAIGDGTVVYAGWMSGYGNLVVIDHGDGVETAYGHASEVLVDVGDKVEQGDHVSLTGSTGNSTGPHLHFEVRVGGEQVDPLPWLQKQGVDL